MSRRLIPVLLVVQAACGHGKPAPAAAPPVKTEAATAPTASEGVASEAPAAEEKHELPTDCKSRTDVCLPDSKFVDRLCQETFPSVALVMFQKTSPWTRGYLTGKTKAWNASGGASESGELDFDEEVIVLRHREPPKGGIEVTGAGGGWDALRWNGSCVTLDKAELTLKRPPVPKSAHITFRLLEVGMRDALRTDLRIDAVFKKHRSECKGATMGEVSLACEKADHQLSQVVIDFVRGGGQVPTPDHLP